ncbi:hypothetical protein [Rhizobium sp. RAF56]|uniref:hypothetical protein n=1 Tax=Rhizobium sp. RAF56 TaxID=3233062 RepID=UPI003F9AE016
MPAEVTMLHPSILPTDWARTAPAGDLVAYFQGHLAHEGGAARRRASAFMDLAERDLVVLSQKRLGPDSYLYLARRTSLA